MQLHLSAKITTTTTNMQRQDYLPLQTHAYSTSFMGLGINAFYKYVNIGMSGKKLVQITQVLAIKYGHTVIYVGIYMYIYIYNKI